MQGINTNPAPGQIARRRFYPLETPGSMLVRLAKKQSRRACVTVARQKTGRTAPRSSGALLENHEALILASCANSNTSYRLCQYEFLHSDHREFARSLVKRLEKRPRIPRLPCLYRSYLLEVRP